MVEGKLSTGFDWYSRCPLNRAKPIVTLTAAMHMSHLQTYLRANLYLTQSS